MGVIDRVHGNTTSLRPVVLLGLGGVESTASLEHRLVDTSTTGDDTNSGTGEGVDGLLSAGRKTDTGAASIGIVTDDGGVVAGGSGKRATVSRLLLDVADDGSLRKSREGENVADGESSLLSAENERASREALSCDEGLSAHLVAVRVTEDNAGERSTTVKVCKKRISGTVASTGQRQIKSS